MSSLRLIASYPRSGNTWVRAFLTALQQKGGAININALEGKIASERSFLDDALEVETSDLLPHEEGRLRPLAYRMALPPDAGSFPVKTHDAWLAPDGAAEPPFPRELIEAVVLIVRDPRDIAPSFGRYFGMTIDEAIDAMAQPKLSLGLSKGGLRAQISQLLSSWSAHTASWLTSGLPLTLIRYEDMIAAPLPTFATIARALNCAAHPELLEAAVNATQIDILRSEEARKGFRESSPHAPNQFFGSGTVGAWRQTLTSAQVSRILRDHGAVMRELGYEA
jgi:hypothetical protein